MNRRVEDHRINNRMRSGRTSANVTNRHNNNRIYNTYFKIFLLSISVMCILVFSGIVIVKGADTSKPDNIQYKYYTSIDIEKNDTLWSIASEYNTNSTDSASYIREIMELNQMNSDCIYQGQHLIIYYYSDEVL